MSVAVPCKHRRNPSRPTGSTTMPPIHYPRPGLSREETTASPNAASVAVDPGDGKVAVQVIGLVERIARVYGTGPGGWIEDAELDGLEVTARPIYRKGRLSERSVVVALVRCRAALAPSGGGKGWWPDVSNGPRRPWPGLDESGRTADNNSKTTYYYSGPKRPCPHAGNPEPSPSLCPRRCTRRCSG